MVGIGIESEVKNNFQIFGIEKTTRTVMALDKIKKTGERADCSAAI